jgi:dethiobiotin synthetase
MNFFITGTDTDVGKTYISAELLRIFSATGKSTLGIKPIACGGNDPQILQNASSIKLPLHEINPVNFAHPCAPHIAAKKIGMHLSVADLINKTENILKFPADIKIIEGVGGFCVPLNQSETMADYVAHFQLPIILVVNIRLGCLNHAILTQEAITNRNLFLAGWIANSTTDDVEEVDEMIEILKSCIHGKFLGYVPFNKTLI